MREGPDGTKKLMPLYERLIWGTVLGGISYFIGSRVYKSRLRAAEEAEVGLWASLVTDKSVPCGLNGPLARRRDGGGHGTGALPCPALPPLHTTRNHTPQWHSHLPMPLPFPV